MQTKSFYVTNGKHKVPIVIRMVIGRGWGQGPTIRRVLKQFFLMSLDLKF